MKRIDFVLASCLCIALLLGLTMCKKESPASIKLSEPTVTLSSAMKNTKVTVTSNVDWFCVGGEAGLGIEMMRLDWIEIVPYVSKAGTTEVLIKLIEDKLPAKEASLSIKLQAIEGSAEAILTVIYKPKEFPL